MTATSTREEESDDLGMWPPESARPRWDRTKEWVRKRVTPQGLVTFAVVALCAIGVFWQLQPAQLLKDTTPAGGDMGAHVWLPAFLKRALLPHFHFTGWAPDWYDGFPALTFYFPLPMWAIALLSYILPYNIAFKLISVLGLVAMPIAAWAFGRLARIPFPVPAVLAAATLPFLFSREFTIYGGNIASTMAGEFSFAISLSLALVFLGLVARGLQNGRHRASAAVTLALCGLCHILPLMFAVAGAVVLVAMSLVETRDWRRLLWGVPAGVTGALLLAFWALPFWWRLPYATDMGYERDTHYVYDLTHKDTLLIAFALAGLVLCVVRLNRVGIFLGLMAVVAALAFRFDLGRLWNARMLPFWFLCLYLLAGLFFCELASLLIDLARSRPAGVTPNYLAVPILFFLGVSAFVLYPLHPTGSSRDYLGISTSDSNFVRDWAYWNYSGYQAPGKTRSAEYFALVDKMKQIGRKYGCGQAMWQYEPELNDMGTPDALMLLPYWTKGCIGSEEGLYYESSASTPYHFLNDAELSESPPNPERGLDYPSGPDVAEGVQHLQMNGDRYFLAETPKIEQAADANSNLQLLATVGPFPVSYTSGSTVNSVKERTWHIYRVLDSALVTPLLNQPVVMKGVQSRDPAVWLKASESWYLDPSRWDVYEAASGPPNWARVSPGATELPRTALPPVQVSNLRTSSQSISFDVDQTGVPVLVRESYFPNWHVAGATGVYRVTPNLMVVVPTSNHVTLSYGLNPIDWVGRILSLIGLVAAVAMWRLGPVRYASGRPRRRRVLSLRYVGDEPGAGGPDGVGGNLLWGDAAGAPYKVPGRMPAPDHEFLDRIFKAYDIRGTVPDQMNVSLAAAVGEAFARFCAAPRILVARDMRPSGPDLVRAFAAGATSAGADVVDIGLCSTDEMYFASGSLEAPGAMFTASHNPAQYNGIKLCRAGAKPVGAETGLQDIKAAVAAILADTSPHAPAALPGRVTTQDVLADYAAKVRSFTDPSFLRPLKVVADTANGMGGLVVPAVFEGLPYELEILFAELDGTFPNHPADPIQPENLRSLQARIRETGADVGLAFDGDADRCFIVDDRGEPVSGSTTTALVAAAMLEKHPGATILYNLICSKAVPEIITERGGRPVRTRVGHSYIKSVMADTDALFGGEHSGHYYFRDNYRADSGAIAALVVLEVLSRSGRPLSEIRLDFERYAASGEINTEVDDPVAVIESVAEHFGRAGATLDRLDGLTVDFGDWWFNLRPSNTEPLLRLNLEAPDRAACDAHTAEVLALFSTGAAPRS